MHVEEKPNARVNERQLPSFFVLTFAISWGLGALALWRGNILPALLGPDYQVVLFFVSVYGPAIAALLIVGVRGRGAALAAYLRRLTIWRVGWAPWAIVLLGMPLLRLLQALINAAFGNTDALQPDEGFLQLVAGVIMGLIVLPGAMEEFGWRGFALPLMQRRWTPLAASAALGAIWAIWHLPAFLFPGLPQENLWLPGYLVNIFLFSFLFTAFFNATQGSLLMSILLHWQLTTLFDRFDDPAVTFLLSLALIVIYKRGLLAADRAQTSLFYKE